MKCDSCREESKELFYLAGTGGMVYCRRCAEKIFKALPAPSTLGRNG